MKRFRSVLVVFLAAVLIFGLLPARQASAAGTKNGYMSLQDAAAYVRKELAAFKEAVQVKFYFDSTERYSQMELWELLASEVMKHTGVPDEGDYMKWTFQQVSYYAEDQFDGKTHYVDFQHITPMYNNTAAQEQQLEQKLDQVMASLNLGGKSDYEKIKTIYQYICENVKYSEEVLSSGADPLSPPDELKVYYTAYGGLVLGSTTCQGFSSLVYRMMLKAGIDCRLIAGDQHGWNIVKLDGKYYYLDATWDSDYFRTHGEMAYFLKGSANFRTGGRITDGGTSAYEHKTWADQFNAEFLDQYPVSVLDYGETDLSKGDANAVIGSGRCGDQATWTLTAGGTLTVSGNGAIWDALDGTFWFDGETFQKRWGGLNGYIKRVEIQQGITTVGMYAFMNCPQLTGVSIPASVESIGGFAFALCEKLPQITLPNTVKTLGGSAFYQCVRLESATLSSGMSEIPEMAFIGCTNLKTVQIPNGIKTIETQAFATCSKLQGLTFPTSVTTLRSSAFAQAFDPAKKVSLTVPATVTKIEWSCFDECGLYGIQLNAKVDMLDGYMFNLCLNLRSVTLSDTIKSFGDSVFNGCKNLVDVKLPSGLQSLGEWPFVDCAALKTISLPATLSEIPSCAFLRCKSLESITIPNSVQTIGNSAFENTNLKRITIPASVKKIDTGAFGFIPRLEVIKFEGDAPAFGINPFAWFEGTVVYYPKNNATWTQAAKDQVFGAPNPIVKFVATHGPNDPHTPGSWSKDANNHWQTCTDCGEVMQTQPHSWDAGRVTKQPNCKDAGTKTYTCTVCGATKTESIPKTTSHSYDFACDEQCNICGATRKVTHQYSTQWSGDTKSHWHACTVCGGKKDETAHTPGPAATEKDPQICTVCNLVISPALNHVHDEQKELCYDDAGHWHACSGCGEKLGLAEHSWQNPCDERCDDCGYTRTTEHTFSESWKTDPENHWHECTGCGEQADLAGHTWEKELCTVCGVQKNAGADPTDPAGTDPGASQPDATDPSGTPGAAETEFPIWIPIVAVVVLGGGGAGAFIFLKKKRG